MKTRSAKAKGKRLERWIRDKILASFIVLTTDDVRVTVGSETGADIKLSQKAKDLFPFKIESKNRETFKTLYSYYHQAEKHEGYDEPLVFIKMNNEEPLVLMDATAFFNLIKEEK